MSAALNDVFGRVIGSLPASQSLQGEIQYHLPNPGNRYGGEYTVTPQNAEQILETQNRYLDDNIVVKEVPYHEVRNESGGTTVTIG